MRILYSVELSCVSRQRGRQFWAACTLFLLGAGIGHTQDLFRIPEGPCASPHTFSQATLDQIGVSAVRSSGLNGSGVKVAQVEADAGCPQVTNQFEVSPYYVNRRLEDGFLWKWIRSPYVADYFPNEAGSESDHADIVGQIFYGRTNTSNPEGVSYAVARVNNYQSDWFLFGYVGRLNALSDDEKVVNQSFTYNGAEDPNIDMYWDNYVSTFSTVFASSIGDVGQNYDHPGSPAAAYNVIGVAAFQGSSVVGPTNDGLARSKPDITAPAEATSFSAPMVAGAAALLLQAAGSTQYASDPRTVKALLLNGAIKPIYQANAAERWAHTETAPLDPRYGAGILNAFNSYKQLQAGKRGPGGYSGVQAGWDFGSISASSTKTYTFTLTGGPYTGTATLVWHRRQNQSSINNLNLTLLNGGDVIAASTSTVDNVEHLFLQELPAGTYDLKVERTNNVVSGDEDYALAFNFAPLQLTGVVSRKVHDGAGTFDIPLPLTGSPGIECRSGGSNGEHQLVFTFALPVTLNKAELTTGVGSVASFSGNGTTSVTVNLSGITNAQTIAVTLFGVNDGTNMADLTISMGVLLGDVNASRRTDAGDVTQVRQNTVQITAQDNFRYDVNLSGRIDAGDVTVTRQQTVTTLP